jgi:hypothetical protein
LQRAEKLLNAQIKLSSGGIWPAGTSLWPNEDNEISIMPTAKLDGNDRASLLREMRPTACGPHDAQNWCIWPSATAN